MCLEGFTEIGFCENGEESFIWSTFDHTSNGPTARCGELLATTTVKYTSDFGLAVRGILSAEETGVYAKRQKTIAPME